MSNLEAALEYLHRGWSVVPLHSAKDGACSCKSGKKCRRAGKHPRVFWKEFQTRLPTKKEVEGWWTERADSPVAIVTGAVSKLVVLDVDGPKGEDNLEAMGAPPITPTVQTGKGLHLYFRHPGGLELRPWANPDRAEDVRSVPEHLKGLDFRGDGGYVVAPPSLHASGRVYAWKVDPKAVELAEVPDWLLDLCTGEAESVEVLPLEGEGPDPLEAPEGSPDQEVKRGLQLKAPPLSDLLDDFVENPVETTEEPGSTPLPAEWELMRAVFGGASRWALEGFQKDDEAEKRYKDALKRGRLTRGLHVFAGHTGGGKTALACGMALAALRSGHPVVYLSLELDQPEIAARMIALEAAQKGGDGLPWSVISQRRRLSTGQQEKKKEAIEALREPLKLLYVWSPDPGPEDDLPTVKELRELVGEAWENAGRKTPLVVFDYLQAPGIFAQDAEQERWKPLRERIGAIIMQVRHLSKADSRNPSWIGCPVLVLSTTARSNVTGKGPVAVPGMSGEDSDELRKADLETLKALPKEAGEIEATAVTSWALALSPSKGEGPHLPLTLRVAKNRMGPAGQWLPLNFEGATGLIQDAPDRYPKAHAADAKPDITGIVNQAPKNAKIPPQRQAKGRKSS